MKIVVLGSAAGGGSPQWNCRCSVCMLAWSGDSRVKRRTQASLAVSVNGKNWCLLNCSPDIREQIGFVDALRPRGELRDSPVRDVVLTNADIDHIGGLLSLREGHRFAIHATGDTLNVLKQNPVFGVLAADKVARRRLAIGVKQPISGDLTVQCFMVPGKLPLYLEGAAPDTKLKSGNTVGVAVSSGAKSFYYIPGCAELDAETRTRIENAELVFFDGTLWSDDEMIASGTGPKTGRRMGHMPVGGTDGSLAALKQLGVKRLVYTHMNNTNPMLIEGSDQHLAVIAAGAETGYDGLEIAL
ncbi:MAG: pyrroloquinoline quinone biosynthesis protein PqqB [Hyphomicrobiales bacterium]